MRPNAPALPADGIRPSFPPYRACFAAASEPAQRRRRRSRRGGDREAYTGEYVRSIIVLPLKKKKKKCIFLLTRAVNTLLAGMLTREKSRIAYSFPKVRPHAPDTVQTPSHAGLSLWRRFQLSLWTFGGRLQDHDVKYAVKTGMATAILAAPAFIEATRPTFMEYRGEWALISVSGLNVSLLWMGRGHVRDDLPGVYSSSS